MPKTTIGSEKKRGRDTPPPPIKERLFYSGKEKNQHPEQKPQTQSQTGKLPVTPNKKTPEKKRGVKKKNEIRIGGV